MDAKAIAIIQSNYIPWKGYFNIIKCVDEFVLLDDVQYTRRDWRNRNLIKTQSGLKWLTIPVETKGKYFTPIKDVQTAGKDWRSDHWNKIVQSYRHAPYFSFFGPRLEQLYSEDHEINLSKINYKFIQVINEILNITTPIRWSMELDAPEGKTERLVHICKCLNAQKYLSGLAAKDYLDESMFQQNNIEVLWTDYSNFPPYRQAHGPFVHGVSIIDLIFQEGPNSHLYLKDKIWA